MPPAHGCLTTSDTDPRVAVDAWERSQRSEEGDDVHGTPPGSTSVDEADVGMLAGRMSLHEQIGQMTQVELGSITPDEVAAWSIGSVFSGGGGNPGDGSARAWREAVDGLSLIHI